MDRWENDRTSMQEKRDSDTGNRTPSCRVRGGNVNRYTISDMLGMSILCCDSAHRRDEWTSPLNGSDAIAVPVKSCAKWGL